MTGGAKRISAQDETQSPCECGVDGVARCGVAGSQRHPVQDRDEHFVPGVDTLEKCRSVRPACWSLSAQRLRRGSPTLLPADAAVLAADGGMVAAIEAGNTQLSRPERISGSASCRRSGDPAAAN